MTGKYSVLIGLFPYAHIIDDRLMTWVVRLCEELGNDKRVLRHAIWQEADTPITMLRNKSESALRFMRRLSCKRRTARHFAEGADFPSLGASRSGRGCQASR